MTKKRIRKIVLAVLLVLLLLGLVGYFTYYRQTKQLSFNIAASTAGTIQPPQFLYSFSGPTNRRIQRPIGVLADGGNVYVADGIRHSILVFDEAGNYKRSFGTSETGTPLYLAKNPKDGDFYVTDRGKAAVLKFSPDGKFLGPFDPHLPKDQLPKFKSKTEWQPVAIAFAPDGTMFVTETLNGHRLLIFAPDGSFKRSVGTAAIVLKPESGQGLFQFPNGLMVVRNEVYVADSNNRRVQVFDLAGNFKRIIVTQGLPRGIAVLQRFSGDGPKTADRFVEVDTLSHDVTIWTTSGDKLMSFGEQGVLDGQFNYPDGASVSTSNKIFVADTANGRVDVWGWPALVAALPAIVNANNAWMCLLPLLLLLVPLFLRKRRFVATPDFVDGMVTAEIADLMPGGRRKWLAKPVDYELIKGVAYAGIDMGELFGESEYSESDAKALAEKLEVDLETAGTLALAQRAKVFCTASPELRRLAKLLEIDVVDCDEFAQRFGKKQARRTDGE